MKVWWVWALTAALSLAAQLFLTGQLFGGNALSDGNRAFREGRFEEAAKIYESEDDDAHLLTRRFNAGVSWAEASSIENAIQHFEDVSARADGELRAAGLYNAGSVSFLKGQAIAAEAFALDPTDAGEGDGTEEVVETLKQAAQAYHSAAQFFRSVDPPDADTLHNIAVTKTALRAVLDKILQLEEAARKKEEEDALKKPAELIRALAAKERLHRSIARGLAKESGSRVRLGSRRLRKAEAETRMLTEKLHHHLTTEATAASAPASHAPNPSVPVPPGQQPAGTDEEKARLAHAAEALERAIAAQKAAEISYSKLAAADAVGGHTRAVVELRTALEAFPLEIPQVIAEATRIQQATLGAVEDLAKVETGDPAPELEGSGVGKRIVETIKDKVLLPLAKLVSPENLDDAKAIADDEDDVVWGARILSQAVVSAPPPSADPAQAAPPGVPPSPEPPQLTAEEAQELTEGLQREGKIAFDAASEAKSELEAGRTASALPEAQKALEALKRAAELLPKKPETPEERLRKLIAKQELAAQAAEGLTDLEDDARTSASEELTRSQREDGKEASSVAEELEKRPDEPAKNAAVKVREGETEIYSSAEALSRLLEAEARLAIERDIALLKEALAILTGEDENQDEQKDQEQQKKEDEKQQGDSDDKKNKQGGDARALTPREARFRQQEMDRKRRQEEAKIFAAPSGLTVERDW